jgi:hypothetical protein
MLSSFPDRIDQHSAHVTAGLVAGLLLAALALDLPWLVLLLGAGFGVRAALGPRFSPLARAGAAIAHRWRSPRPVPSAPRRFAWTLGATLTLASSAMLLAGASGPGRVCAALVALFAGLEAGAGFCVGCWLFARLQSAGLLPAWACPECAAGRCAPLAARERPLSEAAKRPDP